MKQNDTTPEEGALTTKKRAALKKETDAAAAATAPQGEPDAAAAVAAVAKPAGDEGLDPRIESALRAASDKKAHDLVVLDLRPIATFTDYFMIASGTNARQVQAIADEITERLKREGTRAERIEGHKTAEWVLVDYGDFIVHIFEDKARRFYDLERLWREGRRVPLPADLQADAGAARQEGAGSSSSSLSDES
ncbi:MAG: ribosome-associated protein [Pyrinomonadaceae bacterium]|jgi:ribosome-associated protein|nr:ribosome-associated protein [Pyrinomonadaceae bacterium]